MTVDGTPVSDADLARMHAEEELHAEWQRRTVRVVAGAASDAADCRLLLTILGLDESVIAQARAQADGAAANTTTSTKAAGSAKATAKAKRPMAKAKGPASKKSAAAAKARKARSHAAA